MLFAWASHSITSGHLAEVTFPIGCQSCTNDRFDLLETVIEWMHDGQSEASVVGLSTRCSECQNEPPVFDQTQHGYDGELGHLRFMEGARASQDLVSMDGSYVRSSKISVAFVFNIPLEELEGAESESGVRVQDQFDWIRVCILGDSGNEWVEVWDCECA